MGRFVWTVFLSGVAAMTMPQSLTADGLELSLRDQTQTGAHQADVQHRDWVIRTRDASWKPEETAIVVCDVWDFHHCLNAVRRLEQFAPRLNNVLTKARKQGVTIIHSPSDCMDAYADHPARRRATQAPVSPVLPHDVKSWCSLIPAEERAEYPVDQSDGGEDDDPEEHVVWAAKLQAMGRNPGMPWKSQNKLITIDEHKDYISDRGDEVWNVLEQRGIRNVILTGVHLNMCVLGRPFGLRQMARNGKNVVLMRDMTDTMYNPKSWPFVTHQHATSLVVSHVERFVCPTITSDQIVGGEPFRMKTVGDASPDPSPTMATSAEEYSRRWVNMTVPGSWVEQSNGLLNGYAGSGWYRCVIRVPNEWLTSNLQSDLQSDLRLQIPDAANLKGWLNGQPLESGRDSMTVPRDAVEVDDFNLLVIHSPGAKHQLRTTPVLTSGKRKLKLAGRWQFRTGENESFANMPLPAKFGGSTDIVFSPDDPLFVARPLTRTGEFTSGIEGPACDKDGNVYAVNFERQGTIGRITPGGVGEVFVELPAGSIGNGIRFDREGLMYVADYKKHNILKIDSTTRAITVHAHNSEMNQPNDLAIAADGTLYASDPNWKDRTGQLWRIDRDGTTTRLAKDMGTTNGIEVSPDNRTLYVNESKQKNIWAFDINPDKSLSNKRLLKKFDDHGFDGMRCDVAGNLYVTRMGKGTVVKLSPDGRILREIILPGKRPSNICFGGPDGRTAYITEVDFTRVVSFRVDQAGLAWSRAAQ